MAELTVGAKRLLDEYLYRVREALEGQRVDREEILGDVASHVHEALEAEPQPVGEIGMQRVLDRLGDPTTWDGSDRTPPAAGAGAHRRLRALGWGVLAATLASTLAFPWVGPLGLIFTWILSRAVMGQVEEAYGNIPADYRWQLLPPVVIVVAGIAVFLVIAPLFPLVDLSREVDAIPDWAFVAGGVILWWGVLGVAFHVARAQFRWLAHPLLDFNARSRGFVLATFAILVGFGGAAGQQAKEPNPPVGRWEIQASMGSRTLSGSITLWTDSSGAGGRLELGGLPPAAVTSVEASADTIRLGLRLPEGPATAFWVRSGTRTIAGEIRAGPNRIPFTGTRSDLPESGSLDAGEAIRTLIRANATSMLVAHGEPGLAVAVVDSGQVWVAGFGTADPATGAPVVDSTLFQLGSISKTLTAWGVLHLVEEGRIDLDRPVNAYLRTWHLEGSSPGADQVTVRQLLSHTGGVNLPSISGVDVGDSVPSLRSELEGRGDPERRVRVVRSPGEAYEYSGGGYVVLQLLVQEVTGQPFAEWMREQVLRPLGMNHAEFGWSERVAALIATPTSPDPARNRRYRRFAGLAAAGLYASASDMAAFLSAHWPGPDGEPPGRGVVSREDIQWMTSADPIAVRYGLGYEVYPAVAGTRIAGHGGSNVGWKANFIVVPDRRLGVALLSNADRGEARAALLIGIRDRIVGALDGAREQ